MIMMMMTRRSFLFIIIIFCAICEGSSQNTTFSRGDLFLNKILKNYDKYTLPPIEDGQQRKVDIMIKPKDIFDFSESDASFSIRYFLSMSWKDTRLAFNPATHSHNINILQVPIEIVKSKGSEFCWSVIFVRSLFVSYVSIFATHCYFFQCFCGIFIWVMKKQPVASVKEVCQGSAVHFTWSMMAQFTSTGRWWAMSDAPWIFTIIHLTHKSVLLLWGAIPLVMML